MHDCRRSIQGNSTRTVCLSMYLILKLKKQTKKPQTNPDCCSEGTQEKVFENTTSGKTNGRFFVHFSR